MSPWSLEVPPVAYAVTKALITKAAPIVTRAARLRPSRGRKPVR